MSAEEFPRRRGHRSRSWLGSVPAPQPGGGETWLRNGRKGLRAALPVNQGRKGTVSRPGLLLHLPTLVYMPYVIIYYYVSIFITHGLVILITVLHALVENFQITSPSKFFDYAIKKKKCPESKGARAGMWAGDT